METNVGKYHSEVRAIKKLLCTPEIVRKHARKNRLVLVNVRISLHGMLGSSTPCHHCAVFLRKYLHFFHTLIFTNTDRETEYCSPTQFLAEMPRFLSHMSLGHRRKRKMMG